MDDKQMDNDNEIEDGEIFCSSDNDDVCENLENKYTTSTTVKSLLPNLIKTDFDNIAGVNKNCMIMEKLSNRFDRKRLNETNSMNINSIDEINQQYICDDESNIFVRGGSPIKQQNNYYENSTLYYDEISYDSDDNFEKYSLYERKKRRKSKKNKNRNDKYKNMHRTKGQRMKRNGNGSSNNEQTVYKRKKLCKFFLQNKCYRPSQCVFMHGEFPCKYYYLGLKCPDEKNCKLDHGKSLNDDMKEALLRHIQYAPDECLGDFQKIPSDVADKLFADRATEIKLTENILNNSKSEEECCDDEYDQNNMKLSTIALNENSKNSLDEKYKSYDINVDDLNHKMENYIENLPNNYNDIDERMKENFKKSMETENYTDPNFKFYMMQFFLSLNRNNSNLNRNEISQDLKIENFNEFLNEIQIEKLKELGINFVHHLSLLSLANLNTLGISINQISQIQNKALTMENINSLTIKQNKQLDNTQVSSTSSDTDMRILPPVSSPNKWSGALDTDCRFLSPSLDDNQTDSIIDEESELIIDESILSDVTSGDISDEDDLSLEQNDVTLSNEKPIASSENTEREEKDIELTEQLMETKSKLEKNHYDYSFLLHLIEENINNDILSYGDMDMRYPFVPMINFLPATEINGSINLHEDIEYKVKEILIPEKMEVQSALLINTDPNHPDPRLRKEFSIRAHSNNNTNNTNIININYENIYYNNNNQKNDITSTNNNITTKISTPIRGTDPRKRFDNQTTIESSLITKTSTQLSGNNYAKPSLECNNSNSVQFLQFYLQKSQWYHDQNSKTKIEINDLIDILNTAIKNFHKENCPNQKFYIFDLYCGQKINQILRNLGIDVNCDGYIVEINRLNQNNEQEEQNNNVNDKDSFNNSDINFTFNKSSNTNNKFNNSKNNNSQLYPRYFKPPPLLSSLASITPLSPVLKPGLLGFAPGMPCNDTNKNLPSIFSPPSTHYYPQYSQDSNYVMNSYNQTYQRNFHTNFFQRNYRKINDRI